jgi:hypothetical protein
MAMPDFMVMIAADEAADARLAPSVMKGLVDRRRAFAAVR